MILGPAEFASVETRDLRDTACLVFDVLRATSTMAVAFHHGVRAIRPVGTIEEAVKERRAEAGVLLAGERGGLRITAAQSGGVAFDLGNSPREFEAGVVAGRTLVMTTTNGTRALRACAGAAWVGAASFLNLGAALRSARASRCGRLLLVASGTGEEPALEDLLAVGAAVERLLPDLDPAGVSDAAWAVAGIWRSAQPDFAAVVRRAKNARRLLGIPELAPDVDVCVRMDLLTCVPRLREGRELRSDLAD